MKVAVITLHRLYNYGSVLQAYATQKLLENAGHQVEIVDYITSHRTKKAILLHVPVTISGIKKYLYLFFKSFSILFKEKTFGGFVKHYLHTTKEYITDIDLDRDPPQADLYVTGSDQVWNSKYNLGVDRGYFLDFVSENAKRVAFVSSFGATELSDEEKIIIRKYISRYQYLSVRENSAVELLKEVGRNDAVWLIDPTLQIAKDEWLRIASKRLIKEKYLILMLLYSEDNGATQFARKIADEKGLKLVKLSWDMKKPPLVDKLMTHRSPEDFLSLFYYAEFVVTNSFHGLAFSINLEKQFIVVRRNEFNSRIESLLRLTNLEKRLVSTQEQVDNIASEVIEYEPVRQVLKEEREKAAMFIRNAIS